MSIVFVFFREQGAAKPYVSTAGPRGLPEEMQRRVSLYSDSDSDSDGGPSESLSSSGNSDADSEGSMELMKLIRKGAGMSGGSRWSTNLDGTG